MKRPFYQKVTFFAKISAVMLFFMVLFSPLLGAVFHIKDIVSLDEKRKRAQFPARPDLKSLGQVGKALELYYDDHFTFRDSLIFLGNFIRLNYLSSSPNPKVIIGKEDWLYYRGDVSNLTEGYSLSSPLTKEQLISLQLYLEAKRNWLADKGIRYLFVVAPDKQSVYPEFLPVNYFSEGRLLDQLIDHLRANSDVDVLDLRDALRRAKADHPVYFKTDTHWNEYAGFIACNVILQRLGASFPALRPLSLADYEITSQKVKGRDMADMLAMGDLFKEDAPKMSKTSPKVWYGCDLKYELPGAVKIGGSDYFATERMTYPKDRLPRVVVFGDSFSRYLLPYFSESFGRAVFLHIWDSSPAAQKTAILNEMPDIVIDEIVERLLKRMLAEPVAQFFANSDGSKLFDVSTSTVSLVNSETNYAGIIPLYQVSAAVKTSGKLQALELHSTGDDPVVQLPSFSYPADKQLVIKIDMTAQQDTLLQLYYMTSDSPQYSESKSIRQAIHKGKNVIYLTLKQRDLYGNLRLDPGKLPGKYLIHSIEIRAIPGMS